MQQNRKTYTERIESLTFDDLKSLLKFFAFVLIVSCLLVVLSAKSIPILEEGVDIKRKDVQFILDVYISMRTVFELFFVIFYLLLVHVYLVHVVLLFDYAFPLNGDDLEDDSQALDDDSEDLLVGRFLNVFRTVFFNFIFLLA